MKNGDDISIKEKKLYEFEGTANKFECELIGKTKFGCWIATSNSKLVFVSYGFKSFKDHLEFGKPEVSSYLLKPNQSIKECNFSEEFILCGVENLNLEKATERTSLVSFKIRKKSDDFQFSEILASELKGVIPRVASAWVRLEKPHARILDVEKTGWGAADKTLADFVAGTETGLQWIKLEMQPATLYLKDDNLPRNLDFMRLKLETVGSSSPSSIQIGDIETDKEADTGNNGASGEDESKGAGFIVWVIILVLAFVIFVMIFYIYRKKKLEAEYATKWEESVEMM